MKISGAILQSNLSCHSFLVALDTYLSELALLLYDMTFPYGTVNAYDVDIVEAAEMEELCLPLALAAEDMSQKEPEMKVEFFVVTLDVEANVAFVEDTTQAVVEQMEHFQCLTVLYLEPQAKTVGLHGGINC